MESWNRDPSERVLRFNCPHCRAECEADGGDKSFFLSSCDICGETFKVTTVPSIMTEKLGERRMKQLKAGQQVYVINKGHPLHLELANIVERGYIHYRVEVVSNKKRIWVPWHWLEPVLEDM